jgi:hypothetical protein
MYRAYAEKNRGKVEKTSERKTGTKLKDGNALGHKGCQIMK